MRTRLRRATTSIILVLFSVALLASCAQGATATGTPRASRAITPTAAPKVIEPINHVVFIPETDLFAPYILVINAGDSVTWMNDDTVLHTVVTAPRAAGGTIDPDPFQLVLQPGQQSSMTLRSPGVYYYLCDAHAALTAQGRAAAMPSVRPYPLPMDGFIYVRGPSLSGLPTATITLSADNQFNPWITVVNLGATVTWTNRSGQAQDVASIPGYGAVNPVAITFHVAAGATTSFRFTTPGIYDYYATGPAQLDPLWRRARARSGVSGYPVPMEGIIVTLDY
jgi:plastocyanin